jgi:hypothetical protein
MSRSGKIMLEEKRNKKYKEKLRKGKQDETIKNTEKELNYYLHEYLCKGYYYLVPQCIRKHIFGRQYKCYWGCGSRRIP